MAYTTVAKVQSLFRDLKVDADTGDETTNTVVTTEEVTEFITRADAIIDGKLAKFYTVPITGAESLKIVEEISTLFAGHRVKGIMELTDAQSDVKQDVQGNLHFQAMGLLKKIAPIWDQKCCEYRTAEIELTDAVRSPTVSSPARFDSQVRGKAASNVITKGGNNW